jgi:hypothetical protein
VFSGNVAAVESAFKGAVDALEHILGSTAAVIPWRIDRIFSNVFKCIEFYPYSRLKRTASVSAAFFLFP